jgi:polyketide cyclase/dehydrase/lipid transport protein
MGRTSATTTVPGRAAEAESLWYDQTRWPAWVDGFGHVVNLDPNWPEPPARLVWDSKPGGRGRVVERVTTCVQRQGQTLEVEDERLRGTQRVEFSPSHDDTQVTLSLEYQLKSRTPLTPFVDWLFVRRAIRDSLARTLTRFANEREGDLRPF